MFQEQKGIALEYSGDTPRIISKARGVLLEKMTDLAEKNGITVYKDKDLAETLYTLDTGEEIPEDLFKAVSRVLAYCYTVNSDFREKMKNSGK